MVGKKRKNKGPLVCQCLEKIPSKIIKNIKYFPANKFYFAFISGGGTGLNSMS